MRIIHDIDNLRTTGLAATIGFFDGVHLGHRFLLDDLKKAAAEENLPTAVITFPKHPREVLQTNFKPKLINSFEEKIAQLATTGIDYCIVLEFTTQLAAMTAHEFITNILSKRLNVRLLYVGYDHRFGHNRAEGFEDYVAFGKECGMKVVRASELDESDKAVSSSGIRKLISSGQVDKAAELLSYPYQLQGTVVSGHKIGRELGFPTANLSLMKNGKEVPANGVYAVRVTTDGKTYPGMLDIGNRPTFSDDKELSIEVNLIGFKGNLYNKSLSVAFVRRIRDDVTFDSPEALKLQLEQDRIAALNILK